MYLIPKSRTFYILENPYKECLALYFLRMVGPCNLINGGGFSNTSAKTGRLTPVYEIDKLHVASPSMC